jgi:hypothetical protein
MMVRMVQNEDDPSTYRIVGRDHIGDFTLPCPCPGLKIIDVETGLELHATYADDIRGEYSWFEKDLSPEGMLVPKMVKKKIRIEIPKECWDK